MVHENKCSSSGGSKFLLTITNFLSGRGLSGKKSPNISPSNNFSKSRSMVDAIPSDFAYFDASPVPNVRRHDFGAKKLAPISESDAHSTVSLPENLRHKINRKLARPLEDHHHSFSEEKTHRINKPSAADRRQLEEILNNRSQQLFRSQLGLGDKNLPEMGKNKKKKSSVSNDSQNMRNKHDKGNNGPLETRIPYFSASVAQVQNQYICEEKMVNLNSKSRYIINII